MEAVKRGNPMSESSVAKKLGKYNKTVILKDGSSLLLRPIQNNDETKISSLFHRLSRSTIYLKFCQEVGQLSKEELTGFCNVDYYDIFALVATIRVKTEERIIAVARYSRRPGECSAELAPVVEDIYQERGIGTHLLEHLADIARQNGIRAFVGDVLSENQTMLNVLKTSGFEAQEELGQGICRVKGEINLQVHQMR